MPVSTGVERKVNEAVIFCESYPQIKNALYIAAQNYPERPVTIFVTGNDDLFRFFSWLKEKGILEKATLVRLGAYRGRIAGTGSKVKKAFFILPDVIGERRYLKRSF